MTRRTGTNYFRSLSTLSMTPYTRPPAKHHFIFAPAATPDHNHFSTRRPHRHPRYQPLTHGEQPSQQLILHYFQQQTNYSLHRYHNVNHHSSKWETTSWSPRNNYYQMSTQTDRTKSFHHSSLDRSASSPFVRLTPSRSICHQPSGHTRLSTSSS